jgi:hypothetical protein
MPLNTMDGLTAAIIPFPVVWNKGALAGALAQVPITPWYAAGLVGAGAAPIGGLNGGIFTGPSVAGQIPCPAAVAGNTSAILRAGITQTGNVGNVWLVDRMWGNAPVVTTVGAQAIVSPAWPPRDTSASINGNAVFLALEASVVTGNGAPITNTTVSYTNSLGVAGRTATLASFPATASVGTFVFFALQSGDVGVKSVQSITLGTSYVSGAIHLIAFRVVCELPPNPVAGVANPLSYTQLLKPTVVDASVLQLVYFPTGVPAAVYGSFTFGQG